MRKTSRNPPWIRDELILALDLYLKCRQSLPGPKSASVIELSHLLNQMGEMLQRTKDNSTTYRNPNGVSMKLMNFRRLDPLYINEGKKGLTAGNKEEIIVWDEFAHQPNQLSVVAHAIRQAIAVSEPEKLNIELSEDWEMSEASEGRLLTRMHRIRERNPKLVKQVKNNILKQYGKLFCFACHFDFVERYGEAGKGLIDVHHTKPIHTLGEHSKTKIEDLVLLCPNCHRVVHGRMSPSIHDLRCHLLMGNRFCLSLIKIPFQAENQKQQSAQKINRIDAPIGIHEIGHQRANRSADIEPVRNFVY